MVEHGVGVDAEEDVGVGVVAEPDCEGGPFADVFGDAGELPLDVVGVLVECLPDGGRCGASVG